MEIPRWPVATVKTLRMGNKYYGSNAGKVREAIGSYYMLVPSSVAKAMQLSAGVMWDCYKLEDGSLLYRRASGVVFTELHAEIVKAAEEVVVLPKVELTVDVEEAPVGEFFADDTEREGPV